MFDDLIFALSIRFFLFDFILFKNWRDFLKRRYYFFRKLFSCTYCQGFWCGIVVSLLNHNPPTWYNLKFAFISAVAAFTWTVIMEPFIRDFEKDRDLPMT